MPVAPCDTQWNSILRNIVVDRAYGNGVMGRSAEISGSALHAPLARS
jgi:hypothetical protein